MSECNPGDWFLKNDEDVKIKLRETGILTDIPQSQLLGARAFGWEQQNELDAGRWDLKPKQQLYAAYTSGNEVTALVHGSEFMNDLYAKLMLLRKNDFVLIAGWEFSNKRWLDDKLPKQSRLDKVLETIQDTGAKVRLLAFDNPIWGMENKDAVDTFNRICPEGDPPTKAAILDGETGGFAMSHHQKEVYVGTSDFSDSCAYVGGMDLSVDRWDTPDHELEKKEYKFYGWHDIQVPFLTAPVLGHAEQMALPLPNQIGHQWSWLTAKPGAIEAAGRTWTEQKPLRAPNPRAAFADLPQQIVEGWLRLFPAETQTANEQDKDTL